MATDGELRHYLTNAEVRALLRAAKLGRYGARNHAMILLAYRHGLRASEVVALRLADLDLEAGTLYCRRRKGSRSSVHPMKKDEVEAVGRVVREREKKGGSEGKGKEGEREYVFSSERGEKLTRGAFWRIVSEAGKRAGLPLKAYAHMLRHYVPFLTMSGDDGDSANLAVNSDGGA